MQLATKLSALALLLAVFALSGCPKPADTTADSNTAPAETATADSTEASEPAAETPAADSAPAAMAALGTAAPDFTLSDVDGNSHSLKEHLAAGNIVVLEWFNPECPVVQAYHGEGKALTGTYEQVKTITGGKVVWLAINSGGEGMEGASIDANKKAVTDWTLPYPVLLDPTGATGKAYGAKATPQLFVISADGMLRYNGGLDEFDGGEGHPPAGTNFVVQAVTELTEGKDVSVPETQAKGCSVKYAST